VKKSYGVFGPAQTKNCVFFKPYSIKSVGIAQLDFLMRLSRNFHDTLRVYVPWGLFLVSNFSPVFQGSCFFEIGGGGKIKGIAAEIVRSETGGERENLAAMRDSGYFSFM
jgi:hypothetical protein